MSLHSYLRQRYGSSTQRRVREFEKRLHQKAKCSNSHIFNMRCRDEGVIPASLRIKPMVRTREGYAIVERASRTFLRARVHQTFRRKQTLIQRIAKLQASLERNLGTKDYLKDYLKVTKLSHCNWERCHFIPTFGSATGVAPRGEFESSRSDYIRRRSAATATSSTCGAVMKVWFQPAYASNQW